MLLLTNRNPSELETISSVKYWLIVIAFRVLCAFHDPGDWSPWDNSRSL